MRDSASATLAGRATGSLCRGALSICLLLTLAAASPAAAQSQKRDHPARAAAALLWSDPGDIKSRDLFYGPGGKADLPHGPMKFLKEDRNGNSPKFDVLDPEGHKWRAKVGLEAQPETVAVRLLWAVGYASNENYFFPDLQIDGLPKHLHRGQEFVHADGHVAGVRLQQQPADAGKKKGAWDWRHNPFRGGREFNGLRVMMALISNWDLYTGNNAIRGEKDGKELYEVTDVGASFGRMGRSYTDAMSKNNLPAYRRSKFVAKVTPEYVDLNFPTHPPFLYVFNPPMWWKYIGNHWIGKHIPRADVRWIASLLAQLTPKQIRDAFRAAGYTPEQVEAYASTVEQRIASLSQLDPSSAQPAR